jgi:hypothetical protein
MFSLKKKTEGPSEWGELVTFRNRLLHAYYQQKNGGMDAFVRTVKYPLFFSGKESPFTYRNELAETKNKPGRGPAEQFINRRRCLMFVDVLRRIGVPEDHLRWYMETSTPELESASISSQESESSSLFSASALSSSSSSSLHWRSLLASKVPRKTQHYGTSSRDFYTSFRPSNFHESKLRVKLIPSSLSSSRSLFLTESLDPRPLIQSPIGMEYVMIHFDESASSSFTPSYGISLPNNKEFQKELHSVFYASSSSSSRSVLFHDEIGMIPISYQRPEQRKIQRINEDYDDYLISPEGTCIPLSQIDTFVTGTVEPRRINPFPSELEEWISKSSTSSSLKKHVRFSSSSSSEEESSDEEEEKQGSKRKKVKRTSSSKTKHAISYGEMATSQATFSSLERFEHEQHVGFTKCLRANPIDLIHAYTIFRKLIHMMMIQFRCLHPTKMRFTSTYEDGFHQREESNPDDSMMGQHLRDLAIHCTYMMRVIETSPWFRSACFVWLSDRIWDVHQPFAAGTGLRMDGWGDPTECGLCPSYVPETYVCEPPEHSSSSFSKTKQTVFRGDEDDEDEENQVSKLGSHVSLSSAIQGLVNETIRHNPILHQQHSSTPEWNQIVQNGLFRPKESLRANESRWLTSRTDPNVYEPEDDLSFRVTYNHTKRNAFEKPVEKRKMSGSKHDPRTLSGKEIVDILIRLGVPKEKIKTMKRWDKVFIIRFVASSDIGRHVLGGSLYKYRTPLYTMPIHARIKSRGMDSLVEEKDETNAKKILNECGRRFGIVLDRFSQYTSSSSSPFVVTRSTSSSSSSSSLSSPSVDVNTARNVLMLTTGRGRNNKELKFSQADQFLLFEWERKQDVELKGLADWLCGTVTKGNVMTNILSEIESSKRIATLRFYLKKNVRQGLETQAWMTYVIRE